MLDKSIQDKISFSGVILSVQPRSNVWRYRLDNRTHSMTGYNIFLKGIAEGIEKEFAVAISEKQQQILVMRSVVQPGLRCILSWNTLTTIVLVG